MEKNSTQQGIIKGAMILAAASFISKIIGMLYRIPVTSALGDQGMAIYSGAFNIYILLITLSAVGIPSAISKLVSERIAVGAHKDAHRVFKVALAYSTLVAALLAVGMWIGAEQISLIMKQDTTLTMPLRALAPTIIIVTIMAVMRGYFQGMNTMTPSAVSQVVEQLVNAIFSIVLAYAFVKKSIEAAATGSTLGTGLGALAGLIVMICVYYLIRTKLRSRIAKSADYKYESNKVILQRLLVTMIPIVLSTSVFSIMTNIDQGMLYRMLPSSIEYLKDNNLLASLPVTGAVAMDTANIVDSLAGQYLNKYFTLVNVPVSLILSMGTAAIPAIAASMSLGDLKDIRRKTRMILKVGMLLAVPASIGMAVFAKPIMALIFQGASDGGELLAYGAISIIFITIAQLTAGILQGMGKQQIPTINATIACVVKVVFNFIFLAIPTLHIYAFIHSTTICYIIYALLNVLYLRKNLEMKFNWKNLLIKPLICAGIMGATSYALFAGLNAWMPKPNLWVVIAIPVAAGIYSIVGIITRTITVKDLENIPGGKKIINRLK